MKMVEFLKDVPGQDFSYEKGKRYASMSVDDSDLSDKILVLQPNSTKHMNLWATFPKSCIGSVIKIIPENDLSLSEQIAEHEILQK